MPNRKACKPTQPEGWDATTKSWSSQNLVTIRLLQKRRSGDMTVRNFNIRSITGGTHGFSRDPRTMDSSEFQVLSQWLPRIPWVCKGSVLNLCTFYFIWRKKLLLKGGHWWFRSILMFTSMWWVPRWRRQKPGSASSRCPSSPVTTDQSPLQDQELLEGFTCVSFITEPFLLVWLLSQPHITDPSSQLTKLGSSERSLLVWSNHGVGGSPTSTSCSSEMPQQASSLPLPVSPPQWSLSNYDAPSSMRDSMPELIRVSQSLCLVSTQSLAPPGQTTPPS